MDIRVYEQDAEIGGKARTQFVEDCLIECGADSFIATKPAMLQLLSRLELEDEVISPLTRAFSIRHENKIFNAPSDIIFMYPMNRESFLSSGLFSESDYLTAICESKKDYPPVGDGDISLGEFVSTHFGEAYLKKYAEPLFGGIYGTGAAELSMKACFPNYLNLVEQYGSLHKAALTMHHAGGMIASRSPFLSMKYGMGSITKAIRNALTHTRIVFSRPFDFQVISENEMVIWTPVVRLFPDTTVSEIPETHSFTYGSLRLFTLIFDAQGLSVPDSTGYLSTRDNSGVVSSATYTTSKWENRSDSQRFICRAFVKGEESLKRPDLQEKVVSEMMNVLGGFPPPIRVLDREFAGLLPQYKVNHHQRVADIQHSLADWATASKRNVLFAGAEFGGVGLPDRIASAKALADKISE